MIILNVTTTIDERITVVLIVVVSYSVREAVDRAAY